MVDKLNYIVLFILSVSFLFFIFLFCLPHKSDEVVIVGEIYSVAWNCFGCLIKKDLVSFEIIEREV